MGAIATVREDIAAVKANDPAAQSGLVIFLSYPGLHAKWMHTPEHWLWNHGAQGLARVLSQVTRFFTGVEIHPAAQLGRRLFIDHAMGVVIGETTVVGDDCVLYQGVTLGGTGNESGKRHPTLGDRVTVGTGAKVLGNIHIGDNVRIGGNSVVVKDVPNDCTVVGIPGRVVKRNGCRVLNENFDASRHRENMPDPVEEASLLNREGIAGNARRIEELERQVAELTDLMRRVTGQSER
jgi:serine O-acetyltransferase